MKQSLQIAAVALLAGLAGCQSSGSDVVHAAGPSKVNSVILIPQGTVLDVRVSEALSTVRNHAGDKFSAVLEMPVEIQGREVIPRGARVTGHVTTAGGYVKGRALMGITLDSIEDGGRAIPIETSLDSRANTAQQKKSNFEVVGGGTGAAIGAVGGGRRELQIPAKSEFTFRLKAPAKLRG
jgi:hypothetical protein